MRQDNDVEGHSPAGAFLVARGFAETMRMLRQVLDVAEARLAAHPAFRNGLPAAGS